MYKEGIVIFLISLVLSAIFGYLFAINNPYDDMNQTYTRIIVLIFQFVILGFIGNTLYIIKSRKVVAKFTSSPNKDNSEVIDDIGLTDEVSESDIKEIRKAGGTKISIALIFLGLSIILQIAFRFIK